MSLVSPPIAAVHLPPPVGRATSPPQTCSNESVETVKPPTCASLTALSFAFDRQTKSLRVVITDEASGEVLRKIEYTAISPKTHRADKMQGVLMDQRA
jgi:uncharacterized FlaG/YvyC family protein